MPSSANDFIAGCVGGAAQVMIGQPFDIVKVRLQAATQGLYNGAWDCFKKITAREGGLPALWKGSAAPLIGVGAAVSIQFGVNEKTKSFMKRYTGMDELRPGHLFMCGAIAGLANSLVSIPVEHTRIRMQMSGGNSMSTIQCVRNIIRNYGVTGLYKGGIPTLWRESIALGIYFSMYDILTRKMLKPYQTREDLTMLNIACAGGLAGITLWFATFPIDMIKTKIQTDNFQNPIYKGMVDCLRSTYRANGIRGLYKGLSPCILRAVPANSGTFIAFEAASKVLKARGDIMKQHKFM